MKILSIDYGLKRVGLAEADSEIHIAFSLEPITVSNYPKLLSQIMEIISTKNIDKILVGLPLGFEEKETEMSKQVVQFTEDLKDGVPNVEIILWNETLTSKQANLNLRAGKNRKSIDSESARIILQEYLDHILDYGKQSN